MVTKTGKGLTNVFSNASVVLVTQRKACKVAAALIVREATDSAGIEGGSWGGGGGGGDGDGGGGGGSGGGGDGDGGGGGGGDGGG